MTPSYKETEAQKRARLQAERENLRSTQETLTRRTSMFQRIQSPGVSIATGARSGGLSLR